MTFAVSSPDFIAMFSKVFGSGQRLQVRQVVVDGISIPVVDDTSLRYRPVRTFPVNDSPKTPPAGLCHFDPCADNATMLSVANSSNRPPVHGTCSGCKLRCRSTPFALPRWLKPHVCLGTAGARAVVHRAQLCRLALEGFSAHGASAFHGGMLRAHGRDQGMRPCRLTRLGAEARSLPAPPGAFVTCATPLACPNVRWLALRRIGACARAVRPVPEVSECISTEAADKFHASILLDSLSSGTRTTLETCLVEGFRGIGIEQHQPYADLCVKRLSKPIQAVLGFDEEAAS